MSDSRLLRIYKQAAGYSGDGTGLWDPHAFKRGTEDGKSCE
jgi:hypothetical protein